MLLCIQTKNVLGQQDTVDNDTDVKKKKKKRVVTEKQKQKPELAC